MSAEWKTSGHYNFNCSASIGTFSPKHQNSKLILDGMPVFGKTIRLTIMEDDTVVGSCEVEAKRLYSALLAVADPPFYLCQPNPKTKLPPLE